MPVYVDPIFTITPKAGTQAARHGSRWNHMIADSREELDRMAIAVGLKTAYRQKSDTAWEHYDMTPPKRAKAVALGAIELDRHEFGLRLSDRVDRGAAYQEAA